MPKDKKDEARKISLELMSRYEGQEDNVLKVLTIAAERGRFDEGITRLTKYDEDNKGRKLGKLNRSYVRGVMKDELRYFLDRVEFSEVNPNFPRRIRDICENPDAIREMLFFYECADDLSSHPETSKAD